MNLRQGRFHKHTIEDRLIIVLQVAICALVLFCLAMVAVDAWIAEDNARVLKLQQHFQQLYSRGELYHEPTERKLPTWEREEIPLGWTRPLL